MEGGDTTARAEAFISRWRNGEGGAERANYALFLVELADLLDLPHPDPAGASREGNDYVFERAVRTTDTEGNVQTGRIDLYKRGCFVLEAKQSAGRGKARKCRSLRGQRRRLQSLTCSAAGAPVAAGTC